MKKVKGLGLSAVIIWHPEKYIRKHLPNNEAESFTFDGKIVQWVIEVLSAGFGFKPDKLPIILEDEVSLSPVLDVFTWKMF